MSFGYEDPDFFEWRANVRSRGRALLLLFLFSDVEDDDAPTRIRVGSHRVVAAGARGRRGSAVAGARERRVCEHGGPPRVARHRPRGHLCHPFLVHAAHLPAAETSPVERAILRALAER